MPTYAFRCSSCAEFTVILPMAAVRQTHACPTCAADAPRVYGSPALLGTPAALHRGIDAAAASAETPQVVRSVPAGAPGPRGRRWSPFTGPRPVNAAVRAGGPHPALPRW
ncbi:FmdB family zinc ribbon protein [Georgenia sp. 311]|uniref:FmdB family zinc ribbon protein n=1 Tax=Georgenia sp. 311 TaxID=2585134 RepID=UPI00159BA876|nr:zinc ribbon domain-containing protein [Georgenia sp. 311]